MGPARLEGVGCGPVGLSQRNMKEEEGKVKGMSKKCR